MSARGKVVVVTGASSGIGRATALRFARKGAKVVLASRREEALQEVAELCRTIGADSLVVVTDVTDESAVTALASAALNRFGRIDVWVNCAGISVFASLLTVPIKDFKQVLDVNIMGYVYGTRAALAPMIAQGAGEIVNVASVIGEVSQPYSSSYAMSKAAVRALGSSLRQELELDGHKHIHVSTVLPATVDTPFFRHAANYTGHEVRALPPVYAADEVARAIVAASDKPVAEIVVGRTGTALVQQHRRSPRVVEKQMAKLTDAVMLPKKTAAFDTTGNLYSPPPTDDAAVVGGWDGASRSRFRRLVGGTLAVGGVLFTVASLVRPRAK